MIPTFTVTPIGRAVTPFHEQSGTPIQAGLSGPVEARLVIEPRFREGLADLAGYRRIWVISWFDRAADYKLKVVPYRDTVPRGLFATRAPSRPNKIGLSCVEVKSVDVEKGEISVESIDLLDGTPIIDIKPYIPRVDAFPDSEAGWFDRGIPRTIADDRFSDGSAAEGEPTSEPRGTEG